MAKNTSTYIITSIYNADMNRKKKKNVQISSTDITKNIVILRTSMV